MKETFHGLKKAFSLLVTCSVILAGCSSAGQPQTKSQDGQGVAGKGGTLVIAAPMEPDTLDTQLSTWVDDANMRMYDNLLARDASGKIVPHLAEKYSVSEDGKVWTFNLRKDVKYHSGEPMTAEHIKKSIERFVAISPNKSLIGPLVKVEAPDPYTVKITMSEPYAPFLSTVSDFMGALDPTRLDKLGDKFGDDPSGTGPLIFKEKVRGASVSYKVNKEYRWSPEFAENKGEPYLDEVMFRFIKDDDTKMLEFKKGTIQVFQQVPPHFVKELESMPGVGIAKNLDIGIQYLGFNNKNPMFQDVRVRQAIAMAVDRDPIVQYAMNGLAKPVFGPLPPTIPGYSEKVENIAKEMYARDVAKSKQLLAEAGWTDTNGDGILDKDGKPFSPELLVAGEPVLQQIAQILQSQLKEVGIDLRINVTDLQTLRDRATKANHDMALLMYGLADPDILYLMFGKGNSRRLHYENAELEPLLVKGRQTTDVNERLQAYEAVGEFLVKESPWVPLYSKEVVTAYRDVEGFKTSTSTGIIFQDIKLIKK
ncbi:ABC transporter substrate-binding protein [Brevibacillus daliensis]|uniref:ABC transporter substrate-binding protein n=1 Tax=Brevibacillus daliensis TaxID=2892995 RepID=UPI001E2F5D66|nr:ABC transporter substrate-binding protein [Brevibacillus daliensis]